MDHVAVLKKGWLEKILLGEKTIESRWYKNNKTPYKKIICGDTIYFKETGKPVTVKAVTKKAIFFDRLDKNKTENIIKKYGKGICVSQSFSREVLGKRYCTLVFLENVEKIEPFKVNKKGYGLMSAWISVDKIDKIRLY